VLLDALCGPVKNWQIVSAHSWKKSHAGQNWFARSSVTQVTPIFLTYE